MIQEQMKTSSMISKLQQEIRVCWKLNHMQRTIQVVCLEDQCKQDRLLCLECLFSKHMGHKNALITTNSNSSLHKLMMFAQLPNAQERKKFLILKYNSIQETYKKLAEKVSWRLIELKRKSVLQIQIFAKTLDKFTYGATISALRNPHVKPQYIQQQVQMINFLQSNESFKDIETVQRLITRQQDQFVLIASKYQKQLQKLFNQFSLQITAISLNSSQVFQKIKQQMASFDIEHLQKEEKEELPVNNLKDNYGNEINDMQERISQAIQIANKICQKSEESITKICLQDMAQQITVKVDKTQKYRILTNYAKQYNLLSSKDRKLYQNAFYSQKFKNLSEEEELVSLMQIKRRKNGFQEFRFECLQKGGTKQQVHSKWKTLKPNQKLRYQLLNVQRRTNFKKEFFRFYIRQKLKQKTNLKPSDSDS